jgi:hypothetical protein
LQEKIIFRALPQRSIEKEDLHAGPLPFIDPEYLISVLAGQPIRRMDIDTVQHAGGNQSP